MDGSLHLTMSSLESSHSNSAVVARVNLDDPRHPPIERRMIGIVNEHHGPRTKIGALPPPFGTALEASKELTRPSLPDVL